MAHGDYDCCAVCDCKVHYAGFDSATKEGICTDCLVTLRDRGLSIITITEFIAWIQAHEAEEVRSVLKDIGYEKCGFPNAVDSAVSGKLG